MMNYKVGFSKDIHALVRDRDLIIAGVKIPYHLGEKAHSDGDVCYHAIAEAILGAMSLKDLGFYFPDDDIKTLNLDSSIIMKKVAILMKEKNYSIGNIDIFISLEKPKLKPFIEEMINNIAKLLECDPSVSSVKVGTNEGFGPVGENKAIETYCVVLLKTSF